MGIEAKRKIGTLPRGPKNLITDVPGVLVGHRTLTGSDLNTGVTVILPQDGHLYREKLIAETHVINGFGKSTGLMQIQELGTLETPIALTNTLSVGTVSTALVRHMLSTDPGIVSVNPVVLECNDSGLNDIRRMQVREDDFSAALTAAGETFEEGAVGAGRGMSCYGLKGGIGSASRRIRIDGVSYMVGTLLLTNFGRLSELRFDGQPLGRQIQHLKSRMEKEPPERGSVITVIATDLPLTARQLGRLARRAQNGLARTGSITGGSSGEVVLCFSTANRIPSESGGLVSLQMMSEAGLDKAFQAVADCVEESVLSSLVHAETVSGMGRTRESLSDYLYLLS
ncbi:MAG: P1 family peptidase [Clostridiales bacterium]|nr:P1 family peptidase [Clostridiales bacterium]